jgi:O-antigen ligase
VTTLLFSVSAGVAGTIVALWFSGASIAFPAAWARALVATAIDKRASLVTGLFIAAIVLLDFTPLAIYRYFLVSDFLLLTAYAVQCWLDRRVVMHVPTLLMMAFGAYLVGLLAGSAAAQDVGAGGTWLHFAFSMLVLTPVTTTLLVRRPELQLYLPAAIVMTVVGQSLILSAEVARGLEWQTGSRLTGALGTGELWIYAAAVTALGGAIVAGRWPGKLAAAVGVFVITTAEMLLRSRMLWITSLCGVVFVAILQSRRRIVGLSFAAALAAVAALVYAAGWYPDAIQRRIGDALRPGEASDLVARVESVRELVPAIEESRAFGIGLGQSEHYLRVKHSPALVVNIHNVVLHAAVEGGILAAAGVLMLPMAIGVLWRAAATIRRDPLGRFLLHWQVATLVAIFIGAQLTPTLYEHTFYVLLAALASSATPAGPSAAAEEAERWRQRLERIARRTIFAPA